MAATANGFSRLVSSRSQFEPWISDVQQIESPRTYFEKHAKEDFIRAFLARALRQVMEVEVDKLGPRLRRHGPRQHLAQLSTERTYARQIADVDLDFGYYIAIRKRRRLTPGLQFRMRAARLPATP